MKNWPTLRHNILRVLNTLNPERSQRPWTAVPSPGALGLKSRGYDAHSHALGRATDLKEILQQS